MEPWLLTQYPNPRQDHEKVLNQIIISARNTIERAFGVIKSIFRCLLKHRTLHYTPTKASRIINCCFLLYNFMKYHGLSNEEFQENDELLENSDSEDDHIQQDTDLYRAGHQIRNDYALSLL